MQAVHHHHGDQHREVFWVFSYLPCMLWAGVLARRSLQDGALLAAAIWGVLVGLHLRGAAWWG